MPVPCLTVVEFIDGVRAGLQLGELPGEVGVPDVGGVLVHGGTAFVFRNDAADSKPEYCDFLSQLQSNFTATRGHTVMTSAVGGGRGSPKSRQKE